MACPEVFLKIQGNNDQVPLFSIRRQFDGTFLVSGKSSSLYWATDCDLQVLSSFITELVSPFLGSVILIWNNYLLPEEILDKNVRNHIYRHLLFLKNMKSVIHCEHALTTAPSRG